MIRKCGWGKRGGTARPARPLSRGGRVLGEIEEWFIEQLRPGDTFAFAGHVLRIRGAAENGGFRLARQHRGPSPKMPGPIRAASSRFPPISPTGCASSSCRRSQSNGGAAAAGFEANGSDPGAAKSVIPRPTIGLLVETFPRGIEALSRLLSLRGAAVPPDARHAADTAAGAGGRGRWGSLPANTPLPCGALATWAYA